MNKVRVGYAMCGSFCTIEKSIEQMKNLIDMGYEVIPIMSKNLYETDTKFGKAKDIIDEVESICLKKIINEITLAEPIGPKNMTDIMVVSPCTGNTLSKLARAITDTPVTMAVKSHLRGQKPVLIALATNDALSNSAKNLGAMLNVKNIYFVPMHQDDISNKPNSLVARFDLLLPSVEQALKGKQMEPIFTNF